MSNSNTAQESLEIMKESEKKVVEESVSKTKYVSRSPSKEEAEKDGGEEVSVRQEAQVSMEGVSSPEGHTELLSFCLRCTLSGRDLLPNLCAASDTT